MAGDGSLVFGIELWRAEVGADPDPRSFADAHVPIRLAVASDFALKMRGAGAGHNLYHSIISPSGSSPFCKEFSDRPSKRTIKDCSPIFTTTSLAPACFAARITRAISACVTWEG